MGGGSGEDKELASVCVRPWVSHTQQPWLGVLYCKWFVGKFCSVYWGSSRPISELVVASLRKKVDLRSGKKVIRNSVTWFRVRTERIRYLNCNMGIRITIKKLILGEPEHHTYLTHTWNTHKNTWHIKPGMILWKITLWYFFERHSSLKFSAVFGTMWSNSLIITLPDALPPIEMSR